MPVYKKTNYGDINISIEAIANLTGGIVSEAYGIVGMASQNMLKDGFAELLKRDNYSKGIVVRTVDDKFEIDLFVVISSGVRISEVVTEVQKRVKYELNKHLEIDFDAVNVFVQGIKVTDN
ncbi:MAG: Asp23/Gls24 family envelope stress response protein [Erysipelothrix sp.]|nr:Asp23/Gls24 family envelope stress response protein [Erysipelothrix sp.]